jgi:hypothetical protein
MTSRVALTTQAPAAGPASRTPSPTKSTGTQTPPVLPTKTAVSSRSLLDSSPYLKPSASYRGHSNTDSSPSAGTLIEGLPSPKRVSAASLLSSPGEGGLGAGIAAASSATPLFAVVDAPIKPSRVADRAPTPSTPCLMPTHGLTN